MPRSTHLAALITCAVALGGCATYEVADRGGYYEVRDGGYYSPSRQGYGDYWIDPYPRERVRYVDPWGPWGWGYEDYGYGRYGWGSPWSTWGGRSRWYGSVGYSRGWSGWGWGAYASPWVRRYDPWFYDPWAYAYWTRPHPVHAPARPPQPARGPTPMPKPVVNAIPRQDLGGPVVDGPRVGGEPLRTPPGPRRDLVREVEAEPVAVPVAEATPMPKPRVVILPDAEPAPRYEDEATRYERVEAPRDERMAQPRFEQPEPRFEEAPRFEQPEPRVEEPRYERMAQPRFEQPEPRFEEAPRFEQPEPRYEEPRYERIEQPRFERPEPRYEEPARFEAPSMPSPAEEPVSDPIQ